MALESDFPMGMRVLAIDDDPASLKSLENLLTQCQYNVEVTTRPTIAMRILRGNRGRRFDMIVTDVHAQGVDGFKFIKLVDNEFHIPVIIVSEDGSRETIARAVAHGSCDYLLKPVRLQELRNIWTHVLRRKLVSKGRLITGDINLYVLQDEREQHLNAVVAPDEHQHKLRSLVPKEAKRKRRLRWTEELHHKFLAAVHALGLNKAVPKKILELMNVGDLTLDHVSSHLQKYKLYVKKLSAVTGHHALVAAKTKLVPASLELSGQSQQQQQQQTQPMTIQDASGNNSFIGAIDNFQDPNDNTDSLPLDCTELFCDLIDFDSLDQLLQHDQTWQYGVAADEAPATVLSDLPSVLMTPLFGSDSFDSDSDFSRILQPIISGEDDDSSPTPQANFSNHLMQSPQQEWHQTIYDQNSSSSSMPNFEVTGTDLLHQASSEADGNATIGILESSQVLQYA